MAAKKTSDWSNRIVRHDEVAPEVLRGNPNNWRTHGKAQQKAMGGILDTVGYIQSVIVNERSGNIVDGHMRWQMALKKNQPSIPVVYVDLSPEEEALMLTSLDPIGQMAGADKEHLAELMTQFNSDNEAIQELISGIADKHHLYLDGVEDGEEEDVSKEGISNDQAVFGLRNDKELLFLSSSNPYGIPDLIPELLSKLAPSVTWADRSQKIESAKDTFFLYGSNAFPVDAQGGVLGFYVHDARFEAVWNEPARLASKFMDQRWGALIAPDFTIAPDMPRAMQIWNVYRSRWVARYWQEAGLEVIPTLMYGDDESHEYCIATLPVNAPVIAVQVRTLWRRGAEEMKRNRKWELRNLNMALERLKPGILLVYGGVEHRAWIEGNIPATQNVVWLESWTAARSEFRRKSSGG